MASQDNAMQSTGAGGQQTPYLVMYISPLPSTENFKDADKEYTGQVQRSSPAAWSSLAAPAA
jgi:hypothetical protein